MGPACYFGEVSLWNEGGKRTASARTVTRTVLLSISKPDFDIFCKKFPDAAADFRVKIARYNIDLKTLLLHKLGAYFFKLHLDSEFSAENLDFLLAVAEYQHLCEVENSLKEEDDKTQYTQSKNERLEAAQVIFEKIVFNQTQPINIKYDVRNPLEKIFKSKNKNLYTQNMFEEAYLQIFKNVESDSFPRFKHSHYFQMLLEASDAYSDAYSDRTSTTDNIPPPDPLSRCSTLAINRDFQKTTNTMLYKKPWNKESHFVLRQLSQTELMDSNAVSHQINAPRFERTLAAKSIVYGDLDDDDETCTSYDIKTKPILDHQMSII